MPKDTKSSGNNKAPACESRGFGHKKEGENFDTPSCFYNHLNLREYENKSIPSRYRFPSGKPCKL